MAALSRDPEYILERKDLQKLFDTLTANGYRIIGPRIHDGAIIYDNLLSAEELPAGWTDEQDGGRYRLKKRGDGALFGYNVGPHSWKQFLFPPRSRLFQVDKQDGKLQFKEEPVETQKMAFIGVRSCDLHAIAVQDRVFIHPIAPNVSYQFRRAQTFIVAINCGQAGGTCFCVSMGIGPRADAGFDIAMTEIVNGGQHYFVVEVGTEGGRAIFLQVPHRSAGPEEMAQADRAISTAAAQMGRKMDTTNIKELLYKNYGHPRWDNVAARCLTCANCTMVCPTCFCSTVEDVTNLKGDHAERWQRWDSCFTMDHSYIHGGSVRASTKARYRQWMTHKLATWIDQFGTSGCVGCGRCITWCPVGIDITEEVRAIRETEPLSTELQEAHHGDT
ncbi:MAG TPA: 4Fe-4S dicluster domain-containing protein [Terriglobia bacterium]|nr:4Fe-4S dicluster domain-containing protein [Terriglobia bacterium]